MSAHVVTVVGIQHTSANRCRSSSLPLKRQACICFPWFAQLKCLQAPVPKHSLSERDMAGTLQPCHFLEFSEVFQGQWWRTSKHTSSSIDMHDTATATHPPLSRKIQINRIAFAILLLTARDCLKKLEEVCNITIKKYPPSLSDDYVYLAALQGNSDGEDCRLEDGLKKLSGAANLSDRCLNQGCKYLNQLFLFSRN